MKLVSKVKMKEIKMKIASPIPLKVGYLETDEERKAMFQLRADVYKKEGCITTENDIDQYDLDNKCVYFIAKLDEKLIGTARIVIDDPLPTEVYFDFEKPEDMARIPRNKRGEVSRIVNVVKGMNHLVSLSLFQAMIDFAKENDLLAGYAILRTGFVDTLLSIGVPIHPITSATLKHSEGLLHNYLHGNILPIYYFRDEAAEFMGKMRL